MSERIIGAEDARKLLGGATPGKWEWRRWGLLGNGGYVVKCPTDPQEENTPVVSDEDGLIIAAAPDLAASVVHHATRADNAEAEAAEWKRRAEKAEAATFRKASAIVALTADAIRARGRIEASEAVAGVGAALADIAASIEAGTAP